MARLVRPANDAPAWTNTDTGLIYLDPIPEDWQRVVTEALPGSLPEETRQAASAYYATLDAAGLSGSAGWLEEGFCFHLPRSRMLTPERLIEALQAEFGDRPLDPFGVPAGGTTAAIPYDYWRAIAAVGRLIAKTPGGAPALLERYIAGCHRRAQVG